MSQQIWNRIFIAHVILGKNRALGRGVCIYIFMGGTYSVLEISSSSDGTGGIPDRAGACCGGGEHMTLRLQRVCGFVAVLFGQLRQTSISVSRSIAGCLSIAAITLIFPGNSTPRLLWSRTSARGSLISCYVCCIAVGENPPVAILAILKSRCMSDCSSCTRPPWLAIWADTLKASKELVTASKVGSRYSLNHIRLRSILEGRWGLFRSFPGTFIPKFIHPDPRTDNILMFNFVDCPDIYLGQPCSFAITGSDKLVM